MSYIEKNLSPGETIVYRGQLSLWPYAFLIVIGVCAVPLLGSGLLLLAYVYIKVATTEVAVTDRRVIAKFGFISRSTIEMSVRRIESIQVDQGILGRIFDYGSIVMSGAGNPLAPIPGISNPMAFRRAFLEYQDGLANQFQPPPVIHFPRALTRDI